MVPVPEDALVGVMPLDRVDKFQVHFTDFVSLQRRPNPSFSLISPASPQESGKMTVSVDGESSQGR